MAFSLTEKFPQAALRALAILFVGLLCAAPWVVYTLSAFPAEATWSHQYTMLHVEERLEAQTTDPITYLRDLPRFFGELIWIPLIGSAYFLASEWRRGPRPALVAWLIVPYLVFSLAQTRMPGYVMIAAPVLFVLQAKFWCWLRDRAATAAKPLNRARLGVLLALLLVLPARYLLEPTNVFERRDRNPQSTRLLRSLEQRLQLEEAVIFNMPSHIEAMFYSRYTVYDHMPTSEQVARIAARGIPIVIYESPTRPVVIPPEWNVIRLSD